MTKREGGFESNINKYGTLAELDGAKEKTNESNQNVRYWLQNFRHDPGSQMDLLINKKVSNELITTLLNANAVDVYISKLTKIQSEIEKELRTRTIPALEEEFKNNAYLIELYRDILDKSIEKLASHYEELLLPE